MLLEERCTSHFEQDIGNIFPLDVDVFSVPTENEYMDPALVIVIET